MGDAAHQTRRSDHNLGNAIDLTADQRLGLARHLAEAFRRQMATATAGRITYLIYERHIASPASLWRWAPYYGPDPHLTHLHISIKAIMRDVIRPWTLD